MVLTWQGFLHFFDIPEYSKLKKDVSPVAALQDISPTISVSPMYPHLLILSFRGTGDRFVHARGRVYINTSAYVHRRGRILYRHTDAFDVLSKTCSAIWPARRTPATGRVFPPADCTCRNRGNPISPKLPRGDSRYSFVLPYIDAAPEHTSRQTLPLNHDETPLTLPSSPRFFRSLGFCLVTEKSWT